MKRNRAFIICALLALGLMALAGCSQAALPDAPGQGQAPDALPQEDLPQEEQSPITIPPELLPEPGTLLLGPEEADSNGRVTVFVYDPDALSVTTKEQAEKIFEKYRAFSTENCKIFCLYLIPDLSKYWIKQNQAVIEYWDCIEDAPCYYEKFTLNHLTYDEKGGHSRQLYMRYYSRVLDQTVEFSASEGPLKPGDVVEVQPDIFCGDGRITAAIYDPDALSIMGKEQVEAVFERYSDLMPEGCTNFSIILFPDPDELWVSQNHAEIRHILQARSGNSFDEEFICKLCMSDEHGSHLVTIYERLYEAKSHDIREKSFDGTCGTLTIRNDDDDFVLTMEYDGNILRSYLNGKPAEIVVYETAEMKMPVEGTIFTTEGLEAHVTFNANGRITKVELDGKTKSNLSTFESMGYSFVSYSSNFAFPDSGINDWGSYLMDHPGTQE